MLQFQHTTFLFALALLPLFVVFFISMVVWRVRKVKKLGDPRLFSGQIRGFIAGRKTLRFILLASAFFLIVIGWANLQSGDKIEKVQRHGVDVIVALDVSNSMLAKDVQPDRLTRAKQLISRMIDKMQNDRIGLIVFAGRAYLQVPLTIDYNAARMMLQTASPSMVPTQGTVIGDAIDMAIQSFSQKERKYKALVIISDGEDHDNQAIAKAREAADDGIIIHTVGIGSPQGATLYDPNTRATKLDENGNPVVSKLNEDELKSIALAGHGSYTLLNNADETADKLMDKIQGMEQKNFGAVEYLDYTSYFQYFLLAGVLLLLIECLLPGAKKETKINPA